MTTKLTKTIVSPTTSVVPGNNITYDITVTGVTSLTTTVSSSVFDNTPENTVFVSLDQISGPRPLSITAPTAGNPGSINIQYFFPLRLPIGMSATFRFVVKVLPSTAPGIIISNFAADNLTGAISPIVTIPTAAPSADLSVITKLISKSKSTQTYITTLTNNGPSDAANVILIQIIKSGGLKSSSFKSSRLKFNGLKTSNVLFTQLTALIPNSTLTPTSDLVFNLSPLTLLKSSLVSALLSSSSIVTPSTAVSLITTPSLPISAMPLVLSRSKKCSEIVFVATIPVFPAGAIAKFETVVNDCVNSNKSEENNTITVCSKVTSTTDDPNPANNISFVVVKPKKILKQNQ